MATGKKSGTPRNSWSSRRIVVVVVPPVDELDLVGPLQVFNSVNRLAGRKIYAIEVFTNAERLIVEGEGGVLTFMAKDHFNKVEGACDSVLLVCGLASRSIRDATLSDWLRKMAAEVRRLGAVCVGAFLLAEAGLLNDRRATTHDIQRFASSTIRCGSKMETSTPRLGFPRASTSPLRGWRRIAAPVWRTKPRASWCSFCGGRADSRKSASRSPHRRPRCRRSVSCRSGLPSISRRDCRWRTSQSVWP